MVQPFEQQDLDQGCPNLDAQSVFASAHEALHLEVLFERLEKQLDLPAVLVNGGDRRGAKRQQVGQQHDLPLVHGVPHHHAPQQARAILLSFLAGESNQLVRQDVTVFRNNAFFHYFVGGIVLQARNEVDFLGGPLAKLRVVVITAVNCDDGAGVEGEGGGRLYIAALGFGDQ